MLRIDCNCGRILKIGDELAGKNIRCPACKTVLAVPKAAVEAISTRPPQPPATRDNDAASVQRSNGQSVPVVDYDRVRHEEKSARNIRVMVLLLVVGGFVLSCAGAVGVGGAWWFFMREKPSPGSAGNPIAIRLNHPRKAGDVREVVVASEAAADMAVKAKGKLRNEKTLEKIDLKCRIRSLEVDAGGLDVRVELTVLSFSVNLNGAVSAPVPANIVLIGVRRDDGLHFSFDWKTANGEMADPNAVAVIGKLATVVLDNYDVQVGTKVKQLVKGTWQVNKELMTQGLKRDPATKGLKVTDGTAALAAVSKETGGADVDVALSLSIEPFKAPNPAGEITVSGEPAQMTLRYKLPLKEFQGPTNVSIKFSAQKIRHEGQIARVPITKEGVSSVSVTADIKYLPNVGVGLAAKVVPNDGAPKRAAKDSVPKGEQPGTIQEKSKPLEALKIILSDAEVKWGPGPSPLLFFSVNYQITAGVPNPDELYTVAVWINDANGQPQRYNLQGVRGARLLANGQFSGSTGLFSAPTGAAAKSCELQLREGLTNIVAQLKVDVTGEPPPPKMATPQQPTSRPKFVLANAKVEPVGNLLKFSADFSLLEGTIDLEAIYSWECELQGNSSKIVNVQLIKLLGSALAKQPAGNWTVFKVVPEPLAEPAPIFELRLKEYLPAMPEGRVIGKLGGAIQSK